jgi:hypothetical protein
MFNASKISTGKVKSLLAIKIIIPIAIMALIVPFFIGMFSKNLTKISDIREIVEAKQAEVSARVDDAKNEWEQNRDSVLAKQREIHDEVTLKKAEIARKKDELAYEKAQREAEEKDNEYEDIANAAVRAKFDI